MDVSRRGIQTDSRFDIRLTPSTALHMLALMQPCVPLRGSTIRISPVFATSLQAIEVLLSHHIRASEYAISIIFPFRCPITASLEEAIDKRKGLYRQVRGIELPCTLCTQIRRIGFTTVPPGNARQMCVLIRATLIQSAQYYSAVAVALVVVNRSGKMQLFCVRSVCVCVFSSHSFWTSSSLDVPAGVTQEEGHTGFLIHLLSAVRALIFLARRIQPCLSLVDRGILCTNDLIVLHPLGIFLFVFSFFREKNTVCRDRTHVPTCQRVTRYL